MDQVWNVAQEWERSWHGNCINTSYGEETKGLVYAEKMGLRMYSDAYSGFNFPGENKSLLDIGGGPYSLLLKFRNLKRGKVVDPCEYPQWVLDRYELAGIEYERIAGEDLQETGWDEALVYNVLQHTQDPEKVVKNALRACAVLRIFEWLDTDINIGHLHVLKEETLNEWLRGTGKVEDINDRGCYGRCYHGVFLGKGYDG